MQLFRGVRRQMASGGFVLMLVSGIGGLHCKPGSADDVGKGSSAVIPLPDGGADPCINDKTYTGGGPDGSIDFGSNTRYICGDFAHDYCLCAARNGFRVNQIEITCDPCEGNPWGHAFNLRETGGRFYSIEPQFCKSDSLPYGECAYGSCSLDPSGGWPLDGIEDMVNKACGPKVKKLRWRASNWGHCPNLYGEQGEDIWSVWHETRKSCDDAGADSGADPGSGSSSGSGSSPGSGSGSPEY